MVVAVIWGKDIASGQYRLPNNGFGGYPQLALYPQVAPRTVPIEHAFDSVRSWVPSSMLFPQMRHVRKYARILS
jgi:hypothetical protein